MLAEILSIYQPSDAFYQQTTNELQKLENSFDINIDKYPFLSYYIELEDNLINYQPKDQNEALEVSDKILNHLVNDGQYLEQTNLLNTLLNLYLSYKVNQYNTPETQIAAIRTTIDTALDETVLETSRGQTVLVSFINILRSYGLDYIADEYVKKAEALTCEVGDNLASTIASSEATKIGAVFPDFKFTKSINGKNSLYEIDNNYKLITFWGSWCPHCQQEKPLFKAYYPELKEKGGEFITFSIETNEYEYKNFVSQLPGIHDSDLLYWTSPVVQRYGIQGTPTIFVLDKDNKIIGKGSRLDIVKEFIK